MPGAQEAHSIPGTKQVERRGGDCPVWEGANPCGGIRGQRGEGEGLYPSPVNGSQVIWGGFQEMPPLLGLHRETQGGGRGLTD